MEEEKVEKEKKEHTNLWNIKRRKTIEERRESDKLRQRRFRAKKREETNVRLGLGEIDGKVLEKQDDTPSKPTKTIEEIKESNRLRQREYREKKRLEKQNGIVVKEEEMEIASDTSTLLDQLVWPNPVEEVDSQQKREVKGDPVQREKDRIRKRRERQRKRDAIVKNQLESLLLGSSDKPSTSTEPTPTRRTKITAEERREVERIRKRIWRAKKKTEATGVEVAVSFRPMAYHKDDPGLTEIPQFEDRQKMTEDDRLMTHRIYNRRYRERERMRDLKPSVTDGKSESDEIETLDEFEAELSKLSADEWKCLIAALEANNQTTGSIET